MAVNKVLRMEVSTFAARGGRTMTLKVDVPNRRVTTVFGQGGAALRKIVRDRTVLLSNDAVRRLGRKLAARARGAGYRRVA